jgi:hypothetical protein
LKSAWRLSAAVLVLLGLTATLRADLPGPHPRRRIFVHSPNAVPIVLEVSDTLQEPRLILPRPLLGSARKVARGCPEWRGGMPLATGAALALTLGLAGLGFTYRRNRPVLRALLVLAVLTGAVGIGVAGLRANPVPLPAIKDVQVPLSLEGVVVEVTDQGEAVRLVVPRAQTANLARQLKEDRPAR